jgi:hypothetical protein
MSQWRRETDCTANISGWSKGGGGLNTKPKILVVGAAGDPSALASLEAISDIEHVESPLEAIARLARTLTKA